MSTEIAPERTDDGTNRGDLLDAIKSGWHWLAGGAVVGVVGAIGFLFVVPPEYEATAVILPATVGAATSTASGSSVRGVEVEPVAQTLERLKMPTFYPEELLIICGVNEQYAPQHSLAKAVKPTLIKGNSLIQIRYRAPSREIAKACLSAVIERLKKSQEMIADPIIKSLEAQQQLTKRQLDETEAFQAQVEKRVSALDPSDVKFSQAMLLLNAALSKREEASKLRRLYADQTLQLSAPITQSATLFEPIYSPELAVFPRTISTILSGFAGGLVFAGLLHFAVRCRLHRKPNKRLNHTV